MLVFTSNLPTFAPRMAQLGPGVTHNNHQPGQAARSWPFLGLWYQVADWGWGFHGGSRAGWLRKKSHESGCFEGCPYLRKTTTWRYVKIHQVYSSISSGLQTQSLNLAANWCNTWCAGSGPLRNMPGNPGGMGRRQWIWFVFRAAYSGFGFRLQAKNMC